MKSRETQVPVLFFRSLIFFAKLTDESLELFCTCPGRRQETNRLLVDVPFCTFHGRYHWLQIYSFVNKFQLLVDVLQTRLDNKPGCPIIA